MVAALLTILRKEPPTDREESIIDRALKWLDENHDSIPVLGDLLRVIQDAPTTSVLSPSTGVITTATKPSPRTWKRR